MGLERKASNIFFEKSINYFDFQKCSFSLFSNKKFVFTGTIIMMKLVVMAFVSSPKIGQTPVWRRVFFPALADGPNVQYH
jgi:hypothetical protein